MAWKTVNNGTGGVSTTPPPIQDFYKKTKSGKKIVLVGDSTTDVAPAMYQRFSEWYTTPGGLLEGATIVNRGNNGGTLQNHVSVSGTKNSLNTVIADKADLYIYCYGINDIRTGTRAADLIKADLKTAIDRILTETSGYILLRIPNTFLSTNSNNWVVPIEKAEEYNNQLWEVYHSFSGYNSRLDIIDIPSMIFGRKPLPSHPLMLDVLHPNDNGYRFKADVIAEKISGADQPHLYDMSHYDVVLCGSIENVSPTEVVFFSGNLDSNIQIGDIVVIGKSYTFTVTNTPIGYGGKWKLAHDHTGDYSKYGVVKILRKKTPLSLSIDKSWTYGDIITTGTYATFRYDLDITSYAFTGTLPIQAGARYLVPKTEALSFVSPSLFFGTSTSDLPANTSANVYIERPIVWDGEAEYMTNKTNVDMTSKTFMRFKARVKVKMGTGKREFYFTNPWVTIGDTLIQLPNTGWVLDDTEGVNASTSIKKENQYSKNAVMNQDGVVKLLKELGLIS